MNLINCRKNQLAVLLVVAGVFLASAFLFLSLVNAAEEAQIQAAIEDLSSATGQNITSEDQALELCNQEQYLDVCADIGKEHDLYTPEEIEQVDDFLSEVKGKILDDIKTCSDEECLVKVANELAQKLKTKNPTLAVNFDLTAKVIEDKNAVVQAAKEVGLNFRDCEAMDPDTAPVDLLRKCARLAKDTRVQKYIPEERRVLAEEFEDSATIKLREALSAGKYQCGDGTLEGCGNFCLNPTGTAGIPPVCSQIASEIFGQEGVKQLEAAHQHVGQVKDYYSKKFILVLPNGKELVGESQIRSACDEAFSGQLNNIEMARACGNFAVKNGFASQAEVDRGLKLLESFTQKGQNVNFDQCLTNPAACRDFLPEDERGRFDAGSQIFEIMRTEIGFDPQQCERGAVDQAIGAKCFEGSKRALAKIEGLGLANKSREARFIIEEIRGHVSEGENMMQRKDEFRQVFSQQGGPGGCRSEAECFSYCSNPINGPECIAFGAKQGVSGFTGEGAIHKFQEYNHNVQKSSDVTSNKYRAYPSDGRYPQFPGQGPYPGFQPGGVPPGQVPGFTQPGPGFSPPPGTAPYYPPGPGPAGPSPECFAAIQAGDFVRAKTLCASAVPVEIHPIQICPASPYVQCPDGQYHADSFRNQDGCWVDGPCVSIPVCPAAPYIECPAGQYHADSFRNQDGCWVDGPCKSAPTYSQPPGEKPQCSDGIDNDKDGKTDYPADPSCYGPDDFDEYYPQPGESPYPTYSPSPSPTYSPGPGGWINKTWKFKDSSTQSSSILSRTDSEYTTFVNGVYNDCLSKYFAGWKPGAGNDSNWQEFGIPVCSDTGPTSPSPYPTYSPGSSPTTSSPAPSCPSGQYWDTARQLCTTTPTTCATGYYWDSATSTCKISTTSGSCPSGYHYHGESGGFCMNDQENFGGTCYDSAGTNKITCPAQPTYSPAPTTSSCSQSLTNLLGTGCHWMYSDSSGRAIYCDGAMTKSAKEGDTATTAGCSSGGVTYTPYPSCPSGQWWDTATSKCTSTATTCATGYYWDSATSTCKVSGSTTSPYPTATTCATGYYWDSATSTCKISGSTSCGTGYFWDSATSTCKSTCPSTQYWNGSACVDTATATYSPTPYPTCASGQYWDSATNTCMSSTITTYTPAPTVDPATSCASSGGTWNGSMCVYPSPSPSPTSGSGIYPHYMAMHCQQLGRTWNGEICEANGLFARFYEGSGMATILRFFYIVP